MSIILGPGHFGSTKSAQDILSQQNRHRSNSAQVKLGAGQTRHKSNSAQVRIGAGQNRRRKKKRTNFAVFGVN